KYYIIVATSLIVFGINRLDNSILNLVVMPIIYLMLNFVVFSGNIFKKLFATVIAEVVILGSELLVVAIMQMTKEDIIKSTLVNESSAVAITIIVKFLTYIIFMFIKKLGVKSGDNMNLKTYLVYMMVPISSLGVMISTVYCGIDFQSTNNAATVLIMFGILLIAGNIAIFYEFNKYAAMVKEEEEAKSTMMKQKLDLEKYKKLEVANNKYVTMIHDTNHFLKSINVLLVNGDVEEAKKLLESVSQEYECSEIVRYSSNTILNTILSDYRGQAEEYGIQYDVFVEKGFDVEYVEEMDVVSMISNMLKNAFEATMKCSSKMVKVQMFMQNDGCFSVIKVLNSYSEEPCLNNDELLTSKEDKEFHGHGIKSINDVAGRYNGYLQTSWEHGIFKSVLILENEK
ncbi:MAG: GHKL domain-containing protein, partial [Lachnospiraceae bacterium]|nr:GHKL domain-containing protein [Lachnospiraceae bacterium]